MRASAGGSRARALALCGLLCWGGPGVRRGVLGRLALPRRRGHDRDHTCRAAAGAWQPVPWSSRGGRSGGRAQSGHALSPLAGHPTPDLRTPCACALRLAGHHSSYPGPAGPKLSRGLRVRVRVRVRARVRVRVRVRGKGAGTEVGGGKRTPQAPQRAGRAQKGKVLICKTVLYIHFGKMTHQQNRDVQEL